MGSHDRSNSAVPTSGASDAELTNRFQVSLENFSGPFDLLLQLIHSKKLDLTQVALAEVTDEFLAYVKLLEADEELEQITEFLVVAATLLDLKTQRLLPRTEDEDFEDIELLESRDLLFARLLQYRAYQQVAQQFTAWQQSAPRRYPRAVSLESQFASLLPQVRLHTDKEGFASIAALAFRQRQPDEVKIDHLHLPVVSVPEQARKILNMLEMVGPSTWVVFSRLTQDCNVLIEVVGRFLALLELYKAQAVEVEQDDALGPLRVAWSGESVDPSVVASEDWS